MEQIDSTQIQQYLSNFSENPFYQAIIVISVGLILARVVNTIFTKIILRIADKTHSKLDDHILLITRPALFYTILLIAFSIVANLLVSDQTELVFDPAAAVSGHSRSVPSVETEASALPSGRKATSRTVLS